MGTDIDAHSGVMFDANEAAELLWDTEERAIAARDHILAGLEFHTLVPFTERLKELGPISYKQIYPDDVTDISLYRYEDALDALRQVNSLPEFLRWMLTITNNYSAGEVAKYGNAYLSDDELISNVWRFALRAHDEDIPIPEFNIFGSARYNGFGVPLGRVMIVFDTDECFERQLSDTGRVIAEKLREDDLYVTEWTTFSC